MEEAAPVIRHHRGDPPGAECSDDQLVEVASFGEDRRDGLAERMAPDDGVPL